MSKIGIRTEGRVTRVEEVKDKQGRFWRVTFTYADAVGISHENSIEEYDEQAVRRYQKPGAVVNIHFHPDDPDEFRWLD